MKNYQEQTPQKLSLTKILQNFGKTSTTLEGGSQANKFDGARVWGGGGALK